MSADILTWDSEFFGFKVARIRAPQLSEYTLQENLKALKSAGTRLVYWASDAECKEDLIGRLGGSLVDIKATFVIDLRSLDATRCVESDEVEAADSSMPVTDLESLAIQSGRYSRFAVDTKVPTKKFLELYRTWIGKSLSKEIAREVLVVRAGQRVVGMVTLGDKDGIGEIGLLAVDEYWQGSGYGEKLVRAAQRWFIGHGYTFGYVVTQSRNVPACDLYKKCGYLLSSVQFFYHFWL
jgi:dTDP-4-amino-4,6-dideoxy-D-galactose acyltransferase